MNISILIGRLTKDVELRYTANTQAAVSAFNLAVDRPSSDDTDFILCKVFGKTAENLEKYCHKGSKIGVQGRIQVDSYEDMNGDKKFITMVLADRIEFLDKKGE